MDISSDIPHILQQFQGTHKGAQENVKDSAKGQRHRTANCAGR